VIIELEPPTAEDSENQACEREAWVLETLKWLEVTCLDQPISVPTVDY
jgi:hypothetical protein